MSKTQQANNLFQQQRNTFPVVPLPSDAELRPGSFTLTHETAIFSDGPNQANAAYLHDLLSLPTGFPLPVRSNDSTRRNVIRLETGGDRRTLGREGYRLEVTPEALVITARETAGVFYGIQTLRQLLPVEVERKVLVAGMTWQVPCLMVTDAPRFPWRGYMLDEGRHFQGKETVRLALDLIALQKLNVFHWHLTEDQGWRIEIRKYPRLTKVGAWRKGTVPGYIGKHDGVPHGGFYTQKDIKEIVAYAAERHITVVPEIEMPGHALAALASYPELSCTGGPFEVSPRFGILPEIYCAGKESVFTFLQNVLDEVMALFPSPFIHIGGDEAPKARWKECPDCQARIRKEGLKDEHALQVYFTNRIAAYLSAHGRRLVGWNEILGGELEADAVPQFWAGDRKPFFEALQSGRDALVSPCLKVYLDYTYEMIPLSKAYRFEPVFPELDARSARHILGLEAPLWTEWVPNRLRLDYQTYPRLTALAEVGWTAKEKKDWHDFRRRLVVFLRRLDEHGVRYAPLREVEPGWFKRLFGTFTLAQPRTKTA